MSVGMVAGGRGAPRCCHLVGRRSRFNPCTPGWFGVGRLACGLFMITWRLQLRCGWFAVVAAASQSAGFVWGSVALLPVVLSSNPAHVAGTFVSVLVSCVLVCPSVV